jgi:hypothetical protein
VLKGQETMMTTNSNSQPIKELGAAIGEIEKAIPDRPKWHRLLDTLAKLFAEAQNYHRKGNVLETRLTLNSTFRLVEQVKRALRKEEQLT